ncbi:hypothetical protein ACFSX9_01390 [Flavobacterium ardleyense]|uniref:Uncharacterized protein n=1 Tax=Flavobacterium ardleyense TaxID=2038737 RepID=A0ABW5Z3H2_9FLAO
MNYQFIIESLRRRVLLNILFILALFSTKTFSQVVQIDSISVFKEWGDCNGKNVLNVKVNALCNPDEPPFDGHKTMIEVQLKNKKHLLNIAFDDPDYQMEMIAFSEKNIWFYNLKKAEAVFIPFTYCSNSDSDKKLSYIVLYKDKKYLYHISFRCNEEEDCFLNEDLNMSLKELNPKIREALIKKIKSKYKSVIDFN